MDHDEAQSLKSQIGTELSKEADGAIFASGKNGKDTFTIVTETDLKNLTAIRLEALTDKRLLKNGPGRSPNDGNFVLTELEVFWAPKDKPDEKKKLKLGAAKATFSQNNYAVARRLMAVSTTAVTAGLSPRKWARITSPHLKLHNPQTRWPHSVDLCDETNVSGQQLANRQIPLVGYQ